MAGHAGVVVRGGWAIVTNEPPPLALLPPGLTHRTLGQHHAVFWTSFERHRRAWVMVPLILLLAYVEYRWGDEGNR